MLSGNNRRIVQVIHAFLDESGTNPETPVLSVAGFYGTQDQWQKFESLWTPKLVGKQFHAKRSASMFPDLCVAIETSKVNGMLCTVAKEPYQRLASAHFKTAMGNAYAVCCFLCAMEICKHSEPQSVSIVMESGQPNIEFVRSTLESMMNSGDWNIADVITARKSDFIQLHAADFMSHVASAHEKRWMERLFKAGRLLHGHLTEQLIQETSPIVTDLFRKARRMRRKRR